MLCHETNWKEKTIKNSEELQEVVLLFQQSDESESKRNNEMDIMSKGQITVAFNITTVHFL